MCTVPGPLLIVRPASSHRSHTHNLPLHPMLFCLQLSLTSLEEVFLSVARQAELEAAAASGDTTVEVHLDGGGTMMVPLGEEHVVNPNTGVHYEVKVGGCLAV